MFASNSCDKKKYSAKLTPYTKHGNTIFIIKVRKFYFKYFSSVFNEIRL